MHARLENTLHHHLLSCARARAQITYGSFTRLDGYRSRLSAADVVYSINALLEEDDQTLDEKGREESIQKGIAITDTNFWNAYLVRHLHTTLRCVWN